MKKQKNPNHGGERPGAGKPAKDPSGNAISKTFRVSPAHLDFIEKQKESFTEIVRLALEEFIKNHPER